MKYNNISVSISSSESDSELRAMNSAIAHIARLQETTSQCALTLCHAVFPVLRLPALRPPASQCAPGLTVRASYTRISYRSRQMDALNLHILVPRKRAQMAVAPYSIEDRQVSCWWHRSLDKRNGALLQERRYKN